MDYSCGMAGVRMARVDIRAYNHEANTDVVFVDNVHFETYKDIKYQNYVITRRVRVQSCICTTS